MKRTVLQKIAGSFRVVMMSGIWGLIALIVTVLFDAIDKFRGMDYYAVMGITDHATHLLYLMGFCFLLIFTGLIGIGGVKIYCYWFDKPDPTDFDAP